MDGNKTGKTKIMNRREKFNEVFNPTPEKEIDPELQDLYIDENDKDNYMKYESQTTNPQILDKEDVDARLQKYKPKQVSYDEWKNRENEHSEENNDEVKEDDNYEDNEDINNADEEHDEKVLVNETINVMEKEDEMYLEKILKVKPDEIKKGKSVADQKKVYDSLIGLRIYIQNILKDINKFPQSECLIQEIKNDNNLSHLYEMTDKNLNSLLTNLLRFNKDLSMKGSFKNILKSDAKNIDVISDMERIINIVSEERDQLDDNVFENLDNNFNKVLALSERVINIWYRKTLVYNNKSNNKLLKVLNVNDFCEHIKKSVEENFDSIRLKTKRKREKFRVVGKTMNSLIEEDDDNIYDDSDFYEFLLKEFFNSQEIDDSQNMTNRYDLTMQYLINRKNKLKNNKKIDQKASKNRKLRFDQHEKIMNFMTPEPNLNEIGRDEIINSLFGGKRNKNKEIEYEVNDVSII
jgi:protein AATF/BFR2